MLLFGARGGSGVNADTAMCLEISDILMRYNRRDLLTLIPEAFENFQSQDASFETIVSSTSQVLSLQFRGNIVETSIAVIFVMTELLGYREYDNAMERANMYKRWLEEVFGFDFVEICINDSRE